MLCVSAGGPRLSGKNRRKRGRLRRSFPDHLDEAPLVSLPDEAEKCGPVAYYFCRAGAPGLAQVISIIRGEDFFHFFLSPPPPFKPQHSSHRAARGGVSRQRAVRQDTPFGCVRACVRHRERDSERVSERAKEEEEERQRPRFCCWLKEGSVSIPSQNSCENIGTHRTFFVTAKPRESAKGHREWG